MSALERIDVDALVPDGFEPVEALRCWDFSDGSLRSLNGSVWTSGQPHEATCQRGRSHAAPYENCSCGIYAATTDWQLPHLSPSYPWVRVHGKVKLWGKIIPGERGVRAQYAYPSAFEVPAYLVDHPALKAFGVPITVTDRKPPVDWRAQMQQMLGPRGAVTASPSLAQAAQAAQAQAAQAAQNLANYAAVPYPLFPARNKPPTHDWLVPGVLALNIAGAAVNLSLLFHLWAP